MQKINEQLNEQCDNMANAVQSHVTSPVSPEVSAAFARRTKEKATIGLLPHNQKLDETYPDLMYFIKTGTLKPRSETGGVTEYKELTLDCFTSVGFPAYQVQFTDIAVLDEIIAAYDSEMSIQEMIKKTYNPKNTCLPYKYKESTYLSTAATYVRGRDNFPYLELRISSDGYKYAVREFAQKDLGWTNSREFVLLSVLILDEMPYLKQLMRRLNATVKFHYNVPKRCADIEFTDTFDRVILIICLHAGHQLKDNDVTFGPRD